MLAHVNDRLAPIVRSESQWRGDLPRLRNGFLRRVCLEIDFELQLKSISLYCSYLNTFIACAMSGMQEDKDGDEFKGATIYVHPKKASWRIPGTVFQRVSGVARVLRKGARSRFCDVAARPDGRGYVTNDGKLLSFWDCEGKLVCYLAFQSTSRSIYRSWGMSLDGFRTKLLK